MEKQIEKQNTKVPRFYINPLTGRMIKSTARTYQQLKKQDYIIDKHKCMYNVKSAERCFNRLLKLYPDVVYPSSNFIDIPKTYKSGSIRAFVRDQEKDAITGYIDKRGQKYKLKTPIYKKKSIPIVKDLSNNISKIVEKLPEVSEQEQKIAEKQFDYDKPLKRPEDMNIIFNPLQNDFVSINQRVTDEEIADILSLINKELIPSKLPPISKNLNNVSAIIKDDEKIFGIVDTDNKVQHFDTPVKIISEQPTSQPSILPEQSLPQSSSTPQKIIEEKNDVSIPESLLETKSDTASFQESLPEIKTPEIKTPEIKTPEIKTPEIKTPEISQEYIQSLPEVHIMEEKDESVILDSLQQSPLLDKDIIIDKIKCLDGAQWDINEKRCISCDKYGLVWDSEYKACKIMLKEEIKKIEKEKELKEDFDVIKLKLVEDNKGKILGYLE